MAELIVTSPDGGSVTHELNGTTTIGRHQDNDIVIPDGSVSSHHATVEHSNGKFILKDLESSNGTNVNGRRITEVSLKNGDVIVFGEIECAFKITEPPKMERKEKEHPALDAKKDDSSPEPQQTGSDEPAPFQSQQEKTLRYVRQFIRERQKSTFVSDLRTIDFKGEVFPFDGHTNTLLRSDFAFWAVTLLAVMPLFLVTLADTQLQLFGFCMYFAAIWGVIFKKFIVEETENWKLPVMSFLFTSVIGLNLLLLVYRAFPEWYLQLSDSDNRIKGFVGFIGQVGTSEELCKAIPPIIYVFWKRKDAKPLTIVLIGVFSGLGFSAFENLGYTNLQVARSVALTQDSGVQGLSEGVKGAMVNVMLRSISSVFGHAVFSGIFAYFIALAKTTGRRYVVLFLMGWFVAALVHGLYDWSWKIQDTFPAIITAFGFILFYGYLTKLRLVMASTSTDVTART